VKYTCNAGVHIFQKLSAEQTFFSEISQFGFVQTIKKCCKLFSSFAALFMLLRLFKYA